MKKAILFVFASCILQNSDAQESFFKNSFAEAQSLFLQKIESLKQAKHFKVKAGQIADPADPSLMTNWALLAQPVTPANLVVFISGTHGIEGFTGSALQSLYLETLKSSNSSHTDFLFIHALNPYGFKNERRVTRNNVDLNRNFVLDEKEFAVANPSYEKINLFLNPQEPLKLNFFSRVSFLFSSIQLILEHSLESLRQAILMGQYKFPKGIFYGGERFEYQKQVVDQIFSETTGYKTVFVVDLHTGYGAKNKMHILLGSQKQPSAETALRLFGPDRIDFGDQKNFYRATGDLITYLETKSSATHQVRGVVFEFGTLNSQNTLGSIESLRRMVTENQDFHFHSEDESSHKKAVELFREQFYPSSKIFRNKAAQHFLEATHEIESKL